MGCFFGCAGFRVREDEEVPLADVLFFFAVGFFCEADATVCTSLQDHWVTMVKSKVAAPANQQ